MGEFNIFESPSAAADMRRRCRIFNYMRRRTFAIHISEPKMARGAGHCQLLTPCIEHFRNKRIYHVE